MQFYRQHYVPLILILSLTYIFSAPFIPTVSTYAIFFTAGFLVILGLLGMIARSYIDVWLTAVIALSLAIARIIFNVVDDYSLVFRVAAILSLVGLQVVLLIGPWSRFSRKFLPTYKHRRHIGVATFLLGLLHGSFIMNLYFSYSLASAFQSVFVFFGFTGLFIMFWLAVTSWDYVQKHISLTWWKIIHGVILAIYGGFVWYLFKVAGDFLESWQKGVIFGFIIFWILVAPWSLPKKILSYVNGWKQLHVLIYIGYASVIIHVWTGIAAQQQGWVKVIFWALVLAVVGSHAVGWVFMFKQYLHKKSKKYEILVIDEKKYYELDRVDSFEAGKGRRFDIENQAIAVYLFNDKFYALGNRCPHQGGPMAEGKIVRGYVVCPWHRYAFHVDDGCGPPGFPDCTPKYPTLLKDGKVYVALTAVKEPRTI